MFAGDIDKNAPIGVGPPQHIAHPSEPTLHEDASAARRRHSLLCKSIPLRSWASTRPEEDACDRPRTYSGDNAHLAVHPLAGQGLSRLGGSMSRRAPRSGPWKAACVFARKRAIQDISQAGKSMVTVRV